MAMLYPFIKPQVDQPAIETDLLLNLLATGEDEIKNGCFRSAEIVFHEIDAMSDFPSI